MHGEKSERAHDDAGAFPSVLKIFAVLPRVSSLPESCSGAAYLCPPVLWCEHGEREEGVLRRPCGHDAEVVQGWATCRLHHDLKLVHQPARLVSHKKRKKRVAAWLDRRTRQLGASPAYYTPRAVVSHHP